MVRKVQLKVMYYKPNTAAVPAAKSAASALMSPIGALFAKVTVASAVNLR